MEFLRTDDLESTPAPPPRRARVANAAAQTRRDRLPPGLDERPGGVKRSYNRKESPPAPEGGAARGYSETLEGIKVLSRALAPAFRPVAPSETSGASGAKGSAKAPADAGERKSNVMPNYARDGTSFFSPSPPRSGARSSRFGLLEKAAPAARWTK